MMRTRFSAWIATNPIAKPISLCLNGAGKAKIAANRMISASTPLQPGSMETANPDSRSRMTFPAEATPESNSSMMFTLIQASPEVNGRITCCCTGWSTSTVNRPTNRITKTMKNRNMLDHVWLRRPLCYPINRARAMISGTLGARPGLFRSPHADHRRQRPAPGRALVLEAHRGMRGTGRRQPDPFDTRETCLQVRQHTALEALFGQSAVERQKGNRRTRGEQAVEIVRHDRGRLHFLVQAAVPAAFTDHVPQGDAMFAQPGQATRVGKLAVDAEQRFHDRPERIARMRIIRLHIQRAGTGHAAEHQHPGRIVMDRFQPGQQRIVIVGFIHDASAPLILIKIVISSLISSVAPCRAARQALGDFM